MPSRILELTPSRANLPEGLAQGAWSRLVADVAARWSYPKIPCSQVELRVAPPQMVRFAADDQVNLVVFRAGIWCHNEQCGHLSTFPNGTVGMATTYPTSALGDAIVGGDIELNAVNFSFDWPGRQSVTPGGQLVPLDAVLLHELGHLLGLADVCGPHGSSLAAPSLETQFPREVMCAQSLLAEPTPADIEKLCKLHPREPRPMAPEANAVTALGLHEVQTFAFEVTAILVAITFLIYVRQRWRRQLDQT